MKAVLVLDEMPGGCAECTLARMDVSGEMICAATEKEANFIIGVDKPGSCLLRPMPERMLSGGVYKGGWNDCLEAIEGSGEDG